MPEVTKLRIVWTWEECVEDLAAAGFYGWTAESLARTAMCHACEEALPVPHLHRNGGVPLCSEGCAIAYETREFRK